MNDPQLRSLLRDFAAGDGNLTVLTGAGISAESGIPTFRGPEGYWTVGSRRYHPQEMATMAMFRKQPAEVWRWYLYRHRICSTAAPNPGHLALKDLEKRFGNRFTLITQNVDGLHLAAGNSPERTFQIHGNIALMRCAAACCTDLIPLPQGLSARPDRRPLSEEELAGLRCPGCGSLYRPHVLWFDETYNEHWYRFESSLAAAAATRLLIIVGTSGATNLPNQVAAIASRRGALVLDIDIEENPFSTLAIREGNGFFLCGPSGEILPELVAALS